MNYIMEIKAFYNRQASNELSASAVALWHTLLFLNNEAWWVERFKAAGTIVRFQSGLSESSFKRARKELVEHGYIEFESQGPGKAPIYKLHSLVVDPAVASGKAAFSNQASQDERGRQAAACVDQGGSGGVDGNADRQVTNRSDQAMDGDTDLGADPLYKQYINNH